MVLVPVNFMLGPEEIAFILRHCGARDGRGGRPAATTRRWPPQGSRRHPGLDRMSGTAPAAGWEDVDYGGGPVMTAQPDAGMADDDPLRLMYTSGTESRPKGVMLSSRSLIAQYVSCIVDGGMSARRRRAARAAPVPLRAAGLLLLASTSIWARRAIILPGPDPAADAGGDRSASR